jgi:hypothetical protein
MVGDVLSRDVLGAQRIGMRSVLIEWPGEIDKSNLKFRDTVYADRVITAMTELHDAIISMNIQWRALHAAHGHPQIITNGSICDCPPLPPRREEILSPSAVSPLPSPDGPSPELICNSPLASQSQPATPSTTTSTSSHVHGSTCPTPSCASNRERPRSRGTRAVTPSMANHFNSSITTPTVAAPTVKLSSFSPSPSPSTMTPTPPPSVVPPFFRPLRIGYAFNTKKSNTCRAEHWFDTEYREDATYVEVDIKRPLEPQV